MNSSEESSQILTEWEYDILVVLRNALSYFTSQWDGGRQGHGQRQAGLCPNVNDLQSLTESGVFFTLLSVTLAPRIDKVMEN